MKPFSPNAERVILLSRQESARLKHDYVGSEHFLLGIIQLGEGTAVGILKKLGLDLDALRREIETQTGAGQPTAATDATTFVMVPTLLVAVAGVSVLMPVRRALGVQPLEAIR